MHGAQVVVGQGEGRVDLDRPRQELRGALVPLLGPARAPSGGPWRRLRTPSGWSWAWPPPPGASISSAFSPRLSAFAYDWISVACVSMSLSLGPRIGSSVCVCPVFTSSSRGVIVIPSLGRPLVVAEEDDLGLDGAREGERGSDPAAPSRRRPAGRPASPGSDRWAGAPACPGRPRRASRRWPRRTRRPSPSTGTARSAPACGFAHAVPPSAAQRAHPASSPSIGPRIRWTRRPVCLAIVATSLSSTTRAARERGRPGASRSPAPAPRSPAPPATATGRSGSGSGAGSA